MTAAREPEIGSVPLVWCTKPRRGWLEGPISWRRPDGTKLLLEVLAVLAGWYEPEL